MANEDKTTQSKPIKTTINIEPKPQRPESPVRESEYVKKGADSKPLTTQEDHNI